MPSYHRLGQVPAKRHVQFRIGERRLCYEEVFGTEGFAGNYSILYHLSPPAQARSMEPVGSTVPAAWDPGVHRHHHLRTANLKGGGNSVDGRIPLLFNDQVTISLAVATDPQSYFHKNGTRDELLFIHEGAGVLATQLGEIAFQPGDYLYVPRGTVNQVCFVGNRGRLLAIEANGPIDTPKRYRNQHGQLLEHAPYWERDFRKPERLATHEEHGIGRFEIRLKIGDQIYAYHVDHHPFDVVGWDGYLYPYAFNIHDFEPRAGRLHVPPPTHQTFEGPGFVVCSFVPRRLDWDPEAVPVPYFHSNVDSDEVLYYVDGDYGARKVEVGSITLHPRGWAHGPSAGAVEASLKRARETNELAVMVDTFQPLHLASAAAELDDLAYLRSWDVD
ncbi:MAG: homogentisate 1,2-dioxygenase [Chloroflexota bacterium]